MRRSSWFAVILLSVATIASVAGSIRSAQSVTAQVYNGPGLKAGAESVDIAGVQQGSPRQIIAKIVNTILSYVALVAVIVLIIAGLFLILSFGSDTAKEKAKKIVLYTAIGLVVILLSKVLVMFFISIVS